MLIFDLSDLSAERRLGKMQSVGGLREVQLFGQDNDGVQMTYFNPGEHSSKPLSPDGRDRLRPLYLVKEHPGGRKQQKKISG